MVCVETSMLAANGLPPLRGSASAILINDGQRLHLQHGPIDLIVDVKADNASRQKAFSAGVIAFDGLLESLVADLQVLREPSLKSACVASQCAASMIKATSELADYRLTPMAAVAGAVADHILGAMKRVANDKRILVNNGGDIAVHFGREQSCSIGIVTNPEVPTGLATIALLSDSGVGGVASSGWRGRSHSLGIADSVTVLAHNAASADALATAIANAVNVPGEHACIKRQSASELDDNTDLGDQFVTVQVDNLSKNLILEALANGRTVAEKLNSENKLLSVCMHLQGTSCIVGDNDMWLEGNSEACLLQNERHWRTQ